MEERQKFDPKTILWSDSATAERPLLVMLHGRGSDEADLFDLVRYLPPELVVASIRAPIPEGPGFSWYRMGATDPASQESDADLSVRSVLSWLDSVPAVSSVGLLGFSQGAAMAVELMRFRPRAFAYVIQLSGYVFEGERPGDADLLDLHVPVFWGRGAQDTVIPTDRIERTAAWLPAHATLDARLYQVGHSITRQELAEIAEFIAARL